MGYPLMTAFFLATIWLMEVEDVTLSDNYFDRTYIAQQVFPKPLPTFVYYTVLVSSVQGIVCGYMQLVWNSVVKL